MGRRVSVPLSAELGVDTDYEVVDLFEGGNFDPKFLKLVSSDLVATFSLSYKPHSSQNPGATLPTLAHNGKSYTSTADVIDYLVSISPKKVAPATSITTVVHEQNIDPNFAFVASVRDLFFISLFLYAGALTIIDFLQRNDEELAKVTAGAGAAFTAARMSFCITPFSGDDDYLPPPVTHRS